MLDDLRNSSSFEEEEPPQDPERPSTPTRIRRPSGSFLGMTAPQRFVLSLMLFMMVCVVGILLLIVFEKVVLPF
jgi:hypothetical protein